MRDLIVVGGSGHAKEVIWLARQCSRNVIGILEDSDRASDELVEGIAVLGKIEDWVDYNHCDFIIAIGSPKVRKDVFLRMSRLEAKPSFATLVHPKVTITEGVKVGKGTIICEGCTLTCNISIGDQTIINRNSTVGHDCVIGSYVTVAPMVAISGNVTIESLSEVGTGSCIRQGLKIKCGAFLGMGGVLITDIPEGSVYVGNPAKEIKK